MNTLIAGNLGHNTLNSGAGYTSSSGRDWQTFDTQAQQFITSGGQGYTTGQVSLGHYSNQGNYNQQDGALLIGAQYQEQKRMSGDKPIVVCGGESREAKDMDDAQQIAESLAHSKSADAYILKPVKKVAPKRDVVTTDL